MTWWKWTTSAWKTRVGRPVTAMAGLALCAVLTGCNPHVKVEPIKVEPIHLTVDVNVRLDQQLRDSFGFEDKIEQQMQAQTQPQTQPAAPPATSAPAPAAGGQTAPSTSSVAPPSGAES